MLLYTEHFKPLETNGLRRVTGQIEKANAQLTKRVAVRVFTMQMMAAPSLTGLVTAHIAAEKSKRDNESAIGLISLRIH